MFNKFQQRKRNKKKQNKTKQKQNIMPIEFLYTTKELIKLRKSILFKAVISKTELETLNEINAYFNKK